MCDHAEHKIFLNSLRIKRYKIEELRERAALFTELLQGVSAERLQELRENAGRDREGRFTALSLDSIDRLGLFGRFLNWNARIRLYRSESLRNALRRFLSELYKIDIKNTSVILTYDDLTDLNTDGEPPVDGFGTCAITPDRNYLYYFVVLDWRFLATDVWANIYARWRTFKTLFLHEISHTILNHPGHEFERSEQSECPPYCQQDEDEADLLSYVIAFWPDVHFMRLVLSEVRRGDAMNIRLNIANVYKMPVLAVVQWIIIMMSDPNHVSVGKRINYNYCLHYAWLSANVRKTRREKDPGEILDYYECRDVVASLDPIERGAELNKLAETKGCAYAEEYAAKQLFLMGTSARDALLNGEDSPIRRHRPTGCSCLACYDEKRFLYNRKSDEVVVLGLTDRG